MNLSGRVKRLEEKMSVQGERFVLIISSANHGHFRRGNEPLLANEIAPGLMVFCYNGRLTDAEIEKLKAEHAAETLSLPSDTKTEAE